MFDCSLLVLWFLLPKVSIHRFLPNATRYLTLQIQKLNIAVDNPEQVYTFLSLHQWLITYEQCLMKLIVSVILLHPYQHSLKQRNCKWSDLEEHTLILLLCCQKTGSK